MCVPPDFFFGYTPAALAAMRAKAPYTHMIRAPGDPKRRVRGLDHPLGHQPHHGVATFSHEQLRHMLWDTLGAQPDVPLTFHALSIHLFDLGADVTGCSTLDRALFSLVCDGYVAMTLEAPILFIRACELHDLSRTTSPCPSNRAACLGEPTSRLVLPKRQAQGRRARGHHT